MQMQGAAAVAAACVRPDRVAVPEGGAPKVPRSGRRHPVGGGQQTRPFRTLCARAHERQLEALHAALSARRLHLLRVPLLVHVR